MSQSPANDRAQSVIAPNGRTGGDDDNSQPAVSRRCVYGRFRGCERQSLASKDSHHSAAIDYRPPGSRSGMAASRWTQMDLQEIFRQSGFWLTTRVCLGARQIIFRSAVSAPSAPLLGQRPRCENPAAVWRRRILGSPQRSLVRIGGDVKRLSVRPEVGANNGPSFIPTCPTCGEEMGFTSISPTCQRGIYGYKCSSDGDRLTWETLTGRRLTRCFVRFVWWPRAAVSQAAPAATMYASPSRL